MLTPSLTTKMSATTARPWRDTDRVRELLCVLGGRRTDQAPWPWCSTFMGIAIHNLSASGEGAAGATDLAAAVRQKAAGLLGTTVQFADLVRRPGVGRVCRG